MSRFGQSGTGRPLPDEAGELRLHHDPEGRPVPNSAHPVAGFAHSYPDGQYVSRHHHDYAQLLYASSGVMRVETTVGFWVVPPQRAVWIPARMGHEITMAGATEMRSLYLLDGLEGLPSDCRVIAVSPLLRELIAAFIAGPAAYAPEGPQARLAAVILDQLRAPVLAGLH
ncbi:MAG: AraC family ligand binding domain-containing protein, partial [Kiloniellales bacterium]